MDDTLLDGVAAMTVAWEVVCQEIAPALGADPDVLRAAIRREATKFWHDEEAVGHWRVRLDDAREQVVRAALDAEGLDPAPSRAIARRYAAEHRARLRLFDDSIETLEALRNAGLRVGLITNGPAALQRDKIVRFDIARHMDVIVIEGEFGRGKPHRAVFEHALKAVGAAPGEAWHVGDNLYADVGGAHKAGLHAVWIHRSRLELGENPAALPDRSIAHLTELLPAIE
jgi:putative hydrolase of the HAD superfamily